MRKFVLLAMLVLCLGLSYAADIDKALISINPYGKAHVEYTLDVNASSLETITIPKPLAGSVKLYQDGEPLDYKLIKSGAETYDVIFTSRISKVKLEFDTYLLTSKIGEYWHANVTMNVKPDATVLLTLPINVIIEDIKSNGNTRTYAGTTTLIVEAKATEPHFNLLVKYMVKGSSSKKSNILPYLLGGALIVLVGVVIFLYHRFKAAQLKLKRKVKRKPRKVKGKRIKKSVDKVLDRNERKVVYFLKDVVDATHSQIHRATKLPKTTLTKVLQRLEKRNLIKKIPFGKRYRFALQDWVFE